jgi:primosomal protein N' (replication factor Y)
LGQLELNTSGDFQERVTLFADVLLPVPITKLFTYRVPFEFNDQIDIGWRVIVQFGHRKVLTGIVAKGLHQNPPRFMKPSTSLICWIMSPL